MKKYQIFITGLALAAVIFTSCGEEFLTAKSPNTKPYGSDPITEASINQNLASAYHILLRDNYASGYNQIYFTSDLRSDDVFKGGGDAADQKQFEQMATFLCTPADNIGGFWELYYRGVSRCNETLANIEQYGATTGKCPQYKAEALWLRTFYYTWLWKNWGNIPYTRTMPTAETNFMIPQLTADEVYQKLIEDLKAAEATGGLGLESPELARVNLAAIYMLKAEIVMYQKDQSMYDEVADNMATIIASGKYDLMQNFDTMWLNEYEWCKENIFESNMGSGDLDWGNSAGNPYGMGTNLPCYISPRSLVANPEGFISGWCFATVRPYLYRVIGDAVDTDKKQPIFEAADTRRLASINAWSYADGDYSPGHEDTGLFLRKYAARDGYSVLAEPSNNYSNNLRIYRFAETLLNYAELVGVLGVSAKQGITAQACLDRVRARAGVASIAVSQENIEKERHREFIGEGRRFWDLVRWGKAAAELTENFVQARPDGGSFPWVRTYTDNKKYLPIPMDEVNARQGTEYAIKQNPY
jgi:hypothetical protein